ncbi:hypothetical protein LR48_Vigan02g136800 [Vigna angularis]|uniref:AP2/ERF domain-containing protein n=1 Tax=Phaseolus angularis TaxID=3914 RepID=A0A0L9TXA3_PHAAN|nr:hypothetical protein LR48_Vigan02g136800 [Vigna angularis]
MSEESTTEENTNKAKQLVAKSTAEVKKKERSYKEAAALAYDQAAFSMRGHNAVLNFPVKRVKESLQEIQYTCFSGSSPALALKERHCILRKVSSQAKKCKGKHPSEDPTPSLLVLEDLGVEYLEHLLSISDQSVTL